MSASSEDDELLRALALKQQLQDRLAALKSVSPIRAGLVAVGLADDDGSEDSGSDDRRIEIFGMTGTSKEEREVVLSDSDSNSEKAYHEVREDSDNEDESHLGPDSYSGSVQLSEDLMKQAVEAEARLAEMNRKAAALGIGLEDTIESDMNPVLSSDAAGEVASSQAELARLRRELDELKSGRADTAIDLETMRRQLRARIMGVDLCILMDCTASMSHWNRACKRLAIEIMEQTSAFTGETAVNLAFVGYRDLNYDDIDRYIVRDFVPFDQRAGLHAALEGVRSLFKRDSDYCEDVAGGLDHVSKLTWKSSTRLVIHFGDAPPHGARYYPSLTPIPHNFDHFPEGDPHGLAPEELLSLLCSRGIDYYYVNMHASTADCVDIFKSAYGDNEMGGASGHGQFFSMNLNDNARSFLPLVVRSVQQSYQSRDIVRRSRMVSVARPSAF